MHNIQEAKTHLSRLVEMAASGEEIIIAKAGKPMARLVPYVIERQPRKGGFFRGNIQESPDCWETDDELIAAMTGGTLEPEPVKARP